MAVLKSTAYGQVRKSVGANNYYRRSGVQIVRSKPTFAPGRVFTDAQLVQQEVMKLAQYFGLKRGGRSIADYMNAANNKLYNASSRYNRMLKNIMPRIRMLIDGTGVNPAEFWNANSIYLTQDMSVGNYADFPYINGIRQDSTGFTLTTGREDNMFQGWLAAANKKRAKSGQFFARNIGCVGIFSERTGNPIFFYTMEPTMLDYDDSPLNPLMEFYFDLGVPVTVDQNTVINAVFFIADYFAESEPAIISRPQYCTAVQKFTLASLAK